MVKQRYVVVPGVLFVAGARVPPDRIVSLTPEEARFDLGLGRIYLDGSQPPVTPAEPIRNGDILHLTRGGISQEVTIEQLVAFLGGAAGATITLSTTSFASGTASGAILAAIGVPTGWSIAAETTFGGRVAVSGLNLVAAQALNADATGTVRLRATNPDTTQSIQRTFDVTVAGTVAPPGSQSAPGGGPNNTADHSDLNNAYLVAAIAA